MTLFTVGEDCGNSPKNIFLQNLTIAFAKNDTQFVLDSVTDDICWNIVGKKLLRGKGAFTEALEMMEKDELGELNIDHIVTHGKAGAVNGKMKSINGNLFAYCDVYEFSGAKGTRVREITSYVIEIS